MMLSDIGSGRVLKIVSDFLFLSWFRCWLRLDTYFIWSFIGPATLIIMVRRSQVMQSDMTKDSFSFFERVVLN